MTSRTSSLAPRPATKRPANTFTVGIPAPGEQYVETIAHGAVSDDPDMAASLAGVMTFAVFPANSATWFETTVICPIRDLPDGQTLRARAGAREVRRQLGARIAQSRRLVDRGRARRGAQAPARRFRRRQAGEAATERAQDECGRHEQRCDQERRTVAVIAQIAVTATPNRRSLFVDAPGSVGRGAARAAG